MSQNLKVLENWFDGTLYPDREPPDHFEDLSDKVDFIHRLCAAWDFGILPYLSTITEVRRSHWRQAVDDCRFLTSHSYHLLREWHDLEPLPYLGIQADYIRNDPCLEFM